MIKKIILLTLAVKITIFLIIFLAYNLMPSNAYGHYLNFLYPKNQKITLLSAYKTWDGQHYIYLAEKGYGKELSSDAFYPLYPVSISMVNLFLRNSLLSGLLISNALSFIAIVIFYLFVKDFYKNKKIAYTSVLLLFSFPTAFYFSLVYSESLFFLLSIAFFYYLYKKRFFVVGLFAFLVPLSRSLGILVFLPLLSFFINSFSFNPKQFLSQKVNLRILLVLVPLFGFFCYLLFMFLSTGHFIEGFLVQKMNIAQWSVGNILKIDVLIRNFFDMHLAIHGFVNSVLDRIFFVVFLCSLPLIYKRGDKNLFIFSLFLGLVPPFLGSFMSYTRYMLVIFPLFMVLGSYLEEKRYNFLKFPLIYSMLLLQGLFLIMQALNYWVA
jgi:hypothetical protein